MSFSHVTIVKSKNFCKFCTENVTINNAITLGVILDGKNVISSIVFSMSQYTIVYTRTISLIRRFIQELVVIFSQIMFMSK